MRWNSMGVDEKEFNETGREGERGRGRERERAREKASRS